MWGRSPDSNGWKKVFVPLTHSGTVEALRRLRATQWVHGDDPDRFPLSFLAYESGKTVSHEDLRHAMAEMYAVDV